MNESSINEQILKWIKENSKNDEVLENFLKELIYEEIKRAGQWKWKDIYREKVITFSAEWEGEK